MKLHLFHYECKNCGITFKAPQIPGTPYGEFLMRNQSGDLVYLNACQDSVFDETQKLFKEIKLKFKEIYHTNESDVFQNIFSVTCDISSDNTFFNIMQKPLCPTCGKFEVELSWGPTNPPEYIEKNIAPVTHAHWNKLTEKEKKILISDAIDSYLRTHAEDI